MVVRKPIEDGSRVRLSRELTEEERGWVMLGHGAEFVVNDFLSAASNPDPQPDDIDVDFYEGSDDHGCSVVCPADAIEVVKTAAEMRSRTLPTREEIAKQIAGALLDEFDTFETFETAVLSDPGLIEVYGKTHDGLGLGFHIRVLHVWETDL